MQVNEISTNSLPSWMYIDAKHNILYGIPQQEHLGEFYQLHMKAAAANKTNCQRLVLVRILKTELKNETANYSELVAKKLVGHRLPLIMRYHILTPI